MNVIDRISEAMTQKLRSATKERNGTVPATRVAMAPLRLHRARSAEALSRAGV